MADDPLFSTRGEQLLHRWACKDSAWLNQLALAVAWHQKPWWKRVGRTPPSPWPPRDA